MNQTEDLQLDLLIHEDTHSISLDHQLFSNATKAIEQMDQDMDQGWQMGKRFVASPTTIERCQIAADRILTALHNNNKAAASLMAAYILTKLPNAVNVIIDTSGEMENTLFYDHNNQHL